MKNSYQRIQNLINVLPPKDFKLADNFLKNRDFEAILNIVESNIQKAQRKIDPDEVTRIDEYIADLVTLEDALEDYISSINYE